MHSIVQHASLGHISIVAVRVDNPMQIQGGDPTLIQGPIQQLQESTLESPKMLNRRIASGGNLTF